jgi:AAT family amino acid transporter
LLGVLASTWWVPSFHVTLLAGPPWLAFISLCYLMWKKAQVVLKLALNGQARK